jgi:hypothetical protein
MNELKEWVHHLKKDHVIKIPKVTWKPCLVGHLPFQPDETSVADVPHVVVVVEAAWGKSRAWLTRPPRG